MKHCTDISLLFCVLAFMCCLTPPLANSVHHNKTTTGGDAPRRHQSEVTETCPICITHLFLTGVVQHLARLCIII